MELLRRHPAQLQICNCKFAIFNRLRRAADSQRVLPFKQAAKAGARLLPPHAAEGSPSPLHGPSPRRSGQEDAQTEGCFGHAGGERAGVRGETGPARPTHCPAGWLRSARRYLPLVLISLVTSLFLASSRAQPAKEYDRRAACLYK